MSNNTKSTNYIFKNIVKYFSSTELRSLAFELNIDWDELHGEVKSEKVISLLKFVSNRQILPQLAGLLKEKRPSIAWPSLQHLDLNSLRTIEFGHTKNVVEAVEGGSITVGDGIEQLGEQNVVSARGQGSSIAARKLIQRDDVEL